MDPLALTSYPVILSGSKMLITFMLVQMDNLYYVIVLFNFTAR
jgi:hypothetical protein